MIKKTLFAALFFLPALSASANDSIKIDFDKNTRNSPILSDTAGGISNLPEPAMSPDGDDIPMYKPLKKWTVMAFINGKNNLEAYAVKDTNEMEMAGSSPDINVVVELGRTTGYATSDGDWTGVRRYLIQKDEDIYSITSPIVQQFEKRDMGDWQKLADFAQWAKKNYPAERYMLIIWDHGSGWYKKEELFAAKGISYDKETGNHISTPQLRQALAQIGKIDVYFSDACMMQMASVAYEIRKYADYIVGSEETEPGDGQTYNTFLQPLVNRPSMTPAEVSLLAVNAFYENYLPKNRKATMSIIKTSKLDEFIIHVDNFAQAVMASGEISVATAAKAQTQTYTYPDFKDLYHFVQLVVKDTKNTQVSQTGRTLMSFIEPKLVPYNKYVTDAMKNSHGVSIYLPEKYRPEYEELLWAKSGKWPEFIKWMLGTT